MSITKDGVTQTIKTSGPLSANEVLLTAKDKGFQLSGLEKNKDYTVRVNGLMDLAGNLSSPNVISQIVKSTFDDQVAPKVTDIQTSALNKVIVKVDKELEDKGTVNKQYVTLGGVTAKASTDQVYDADKGTVTVEIDPVANEGDVKTITVSGYTDLAGNDGANFTKTVAFSNLSKVTKSEVVSRNDSGTLNEYLKVTFDKEIAVTSGDLSATLTTPENVVKSINILAANVAKGTGTETNVLYAKLTGVTGLEQGSLKTVVPKTVVTNLDKTSTDVTVNYVPADANAPAVNGTLGSITAQSVVVTYTKDMGQSALDVNNYTVDGQKVFEKAMFKDDKKNVELTFKKASVPVDGTYDFAISTNVKAENGVAMKNTYTEQASLKENIAPTVVSAKVVNDGAEIEVTFSENITDGSTTDKDFDVYVDGVKYATTANAFATNKLTLTLTPGLDAAALGKTITLKALSTLDIKDGNNNVAVVTNDITVAK